MVLLPLGVLSWLGVRLVRDQEELLARQADDLLDERLRMSSLRVAERMEENRRSLLGIAESLPADAAGIRSRLTRGGPPFVQALVVDLRGRLLFPPPEGPRTAREQAFLDRTRALWEQKGLTAVARGPGGGERGAGGNGWFGWYHGGGLHLVLWVRAAERIVGVELSRPLLLSSVIAGLPASEESDEPRSGPRSLSALVDASGAVAYEWGDYRPPDGEAPRAELPLEPPLASWRLRLWLPADALPGGLERSAGFAVGLGLGALALVLAGGAVLLYRERSREMRLAAQRVSFVSQVSHELKTPLTNIRLYAELLAADIELSGDDRDGERAQQIGVIVSESQRLSRLIGNVLRFARGQEGNLRLRPAPAVLDDVVRETVAALSPSLYGHGVEVTLSLGTPERVALDADAVAQMIANLLSNVDKYAAAGKHAEITSEREGELCRVRVADRGPGVPADQQERIFEAFHRGSDRLTDGVAGTGIGLSIAQRLARLHGGDLRLVASEVGACFELTVRAPLEK